VPIFDYLVQAGSTGAAIVCYHELTRGQFVSLVFCFLAGLKDRDEQLPTLSWNNFEVAGREHSLAGRVLGRLPDFEASTSAT